VNAKLMSQLVLVTVLASACDMAAVSPGTPSTSSSLPAVTAPAATAGPVLPIITPEALIAVTEPAAFAVDGAIMWVLSSHGEISRIDPAKNTSSAPTMVAPGWTWGGFGANAAGLWLGDFDANLVYRIDPVSLAVVAKIPVAHNPDGAGVTADAVWIAQHRGGSVTRINPSTNKAVTIVIGHQGPSGPHDIGFGAGSVWVSAGDTVNDGGLGGAVVRIEPTTNKVQATIKIPVNASACGGFAVSDQAVWMDSCANTTFIVRIDPSTNQVVATVDLGGLGGPPILMDGVPWVLVRKTDSGSDPARLVRINPATNLVDRVFSLGDTFRSERLLLAFGSLWTTDWLHDQVLRLPLAAFGS
jgi:streptogramin lyase